MMICHKCEKEIPGGTSFLIDIDGRPFHPGCWPRPSTNVEFEPVVMALCHMCVRHWDRTCNRSPENCRENTRFRNMIRYE